MHIHILGICGTFMGGLALLARAAGHTVSGSDQNVYPPMSTQLAEHGVSLTTGYDAAQLDPAPDLVVIGNALSRGNPAVEATLARGLPYTSGPQWLAEHILQGRHVLAVAGTHGKTTTSSLLAWILESAGLAPGFLIGGVPRNFGVSARLGQGDCFVVEADEYDTAFFDKRSKFVHYRPRTLILNNLEFDHADIFDDLAAIQRQFHHLIRTVPGDGGLIVNGPDRALAETLTMGCWSPVIRFALDRDADWSARDIAPDGSAFDLYQGEHRIGRVQWALSGRHNVENALAAVAAAHRVGVAPAAALAALGNFQSVRRRMEKRSEINGVHVYDDFAHHPTAIETTLAGLCGGVDGRVVAVLEPRSNTMRLGVHRDRLATSLMAADRVFLHAPPDLPWDAAEAVRPLGDKATVTGNLDDLLSQLCREARPGDHIVLMSNGGFGGLPDRLVAALAQYGKAPHAADGGDA